MGRFPARLWPTRSAKALTRGHRCPESPVATGETPLLIPAKPESTKLSLKALAAASAIPLRAKRAHGKPTLRLVFPSPTVRSMPPLWLPHSGRRSWNPFPWNGFPYPRPYCAPSIYQTALRATLMESVHGTDSPIPAPTAPPLPVRPHSGRGAKEKTVPKDGLFMSGHWPRSIARPAGRASIFVLVDFRKAKIKKGISCPAGHDSGRCPENPRPFEKGRRKLQFACGRELVRTFPLLTSWEPEPRYHPYTAGAPSG